MQFFGKMKDKMGPALSDASQRLKESVDQVVAGAGEKMQESKLKAQLKALSKERNDRIMALGLKIYELYKTKSVASLESLEEFAAIDDIEGQLALKQDEIDALASGADVADLQQVTASPVQTDEPGPVEAEPEDSNSPAD